MIKTEINLLNSYLIKNIGAKMKILEENILDDLKIPLVLKRKYSSARVEFLNYNCLLLFPIKKINTRDFLREIQKIQSKLNETTSYSLNIIVILPKAQKNLITFFMEHRIPFIIGNKQVYLPFVYLDIQRTESDAESFTPAYQQIFLYILYSSDNAVFNVTTLAEDTNLTEMTVRRALKFLEDLQLVFELDISKNQLYMRTFSKKKSVERARNYLIHPILKTLYFNRSEFNLESNLYKYPLSGEMALSELTNLMYNNFYGNIYAISNKEFKRTSNYNELIESSSKSLFDVQDPFTLEIWRYDPKVLSKICYPNVNCVDIVSLWLILKDVNDERIQKELDFLLNDYFEEE